jgi:hypothetical protein
MVYEKLLVRAGGGVVSARQQSRQAANTASVFIGLGGTGIDCVRAIKTQVYARLRPDNVGDAVPRYEHIRFLGVDADRRSIGARPGARMSLDEATEFFPIDNSAVGDAMKNSPALSARPEMAWVNTQTPPPNVGGFGAGAIRQIGRFLLMDKADGFMSAVAAAIRGAKTNLTNPSVNLHVFAGLSGGVGSGTFLDVCYMLRKLAREEKNVKIFGYFFLPDVSCRRVDLDEGVAAVDTMRRNGYAAMQELDYCMNLPDNGGSFVQSYKGGVEIAWDAKPVDMCHLICAADEAGNVIPNPYEYAVNVAAAYVMDFLTAPVSGEHELSARQVGFAGQVAAGDARKTLGASLAYCAIGAAAADLPLREINTYLVSALFERFARRAAAPLERDVDRLAQTALGRGAADAAAVYDALAQELTADADALAEYDRDPGGDEDVARFYAAQLAERRGVLEKNRAAMTDPANADTVSCRLRRALLEIVCDAARGPSFAARMLDASASYSLPGVLAGLKAANDRRLSRAERAASAARALCERARADYRQKTRRSLLDNNKKRFRDYARAARDEARAQLDATVCRQLGSLLDELARQVERAASGDCARLARVMTNLLETFHTNLADLSDGGGRAGTDGFSVPLLTVAEIRETLDSAVEARDVPGLLSAFLTRLVEDEAAWREEDENRIAALVTDFFAKTAFADCAARSVTAFLQDKYRAELGQNPSDLQRLSDLVYRDWMAPLTRRASPLFLRDPAVRATDGDAGVRCISLPHTAPAIFEAANRVREADGTWQLKESALTDRIFVLCSRYVFPLGSYAERDVCADAYYDGGACGVHLYEGAHAPGMPLTDWGELAPVTPNACIRLDKISPRAAETVRQARALYASAVERGLIDRDNWICAPNGDALDALRALTRECAAASSAEDGGDSRALLARLEAALDLPLERRRPMQRDGSDSEEAQRRVRLDRFVASPVFQREVREIAEKLERAVCEGQRAADALRAALDRQQADAADVKRYCDALCTGVVTVSGYSVDFEREDIFGKSRAALCEFGMPFASIPVYQGFVSYRALSAEDKADIAGQVAERRAANAPEIGDAMRALRDSVLAPETMATYRRYAEDMENGADALAFIRQLHRSVQAFGGGD